MKHLSILLVLVLLLASCGQKTETTKPATTTTDTDSAKAEGELVPSLTILSSLPEANMVNYEMANEVAEELKALGVDVTAQPTDFAVLMDVLYGDANEHDMYTIGWSGRIERLDPDMFIHSINHSENAKLGENNTDRYRNEEFDKIADAQRSEMDPEKRKELVFEAQRILAEDVPRVNIYSRNGVQVYDKEKFSGAIAIPGEGLFNEWTPIQLEPLTENKTLKVASNINLNTLNPMGAKTVYEWRNLRLIYDKLVRISPDIEPIPATAESWELVDDTTINVVIKQGLTFHDGEPVTVEDIKYTYDAFIDNSVEYFMSFLEPIESVEILDDNTVQFKLKYPTASFVNNTLTQIPILPKHIWEAKADPKNDTNEFPIGSGPFKFVNFRPGEELVAERFDEYYNPAKIDGYIFRIFGSPEGVLTALELKEVDMLSFDLVPAHIEIIEKNEGGKFDHLEVTSVPDIGFFYLGFNIDKTPFNNKAFRIAVAHLVDYDLAVDVHLNGHGSRGGGGLVINEANAFWHNPEVPIYDEYNPEKAREILEDAGFTWDSQGRLHMPAE